MQRSLSQTIYRYLPGAVFLHEDGFIAKTWRLDGNRIESKVNKKAVLEAVEAAVSQWPQDRRKVPLPSTVPASEFVVIEPTQVLWDVWPMTFRCSNHNCARVRRFMNSDQLTAHTDSNSGLRCSVCRRRMEQIPYFAAHACGSMKQMFIPPCTNCQRYDDVYLQDTGSFETSSWRCRNCGDYYIQGTRFMPCGCGDYPNRNGQSFMRMFTVRDRRSHYPHYVSIINLDSDQYRSLQSHPNRGIASLALYLKDEDRLSRALRDLDAGGSNDRMTKAEWSEQEAQYRAIGLGEADIETLRDKRGPAEQGVDMTEQSSELIDSAMSRLMLERAALLDPSGLDDRVTLASAAEGAEGGERAALEDAITTAGRLGVQTISTSLQFPVLMGAYGYTRQARKATESTLQSFAVKNAYGGKTPVFAVAAETEVLIVELSPQRVYGWLADQGLVETVDEIDERTSRVKLLELHASQGEEAARVRNLVHSLSHAFLRALDDGQSGYGESSLSEWVVPQALTFAIYVSSYQEFSIGALWTLMHSRARAWMERIEDVAFRCQNDPLCHNRSPRACERCLYLTFGCPEFNDDLSRDTIMGYLRYCGTVA